MPTPTTTTAAERLELTAELLERNGLHKGDFESDTDPSKCCTLGYLRRATPGGMEFISSDAAALALASECRRAGVVTKVEKLPGTVKPLRSGDGWAVADANDCGYWEGRKISARQMARLCRRAAKRLRGLI